MDQIGVNALTPLMPFAFRRAILQTLYRIGVGRVQDYGLPEPDHRIGEAHPTISADFLNRIAHGELTWKPNVAELLGDRVRFADGTVEPVDVIVWCTGYKVSFPFFDPEFISAPDNDLPLYRRVFKPGIDSVFFIGLLQPIGAIFPIADAQARWVAEYLTGRYALPPRIEMLDEMERERAAMFKRFVASKRHTMEADRDEYLYALRKELKRGEQRARERSFELPVRRRAGAEQRGGATLG
jgi:hypothetical protein